MNTTAADIDAFLAEAWALDTTKTVKEALAAQIAVIGENMEHQKICSGYRRERFRCFLHTYGR